MDPSLKPFLTRSRSLLAHLPLRRHGLSPNQRPHLLRHPKTASRTVFAGCRTRSVSSLHLPSDRENVERSSRVDVVIIPLRVQAGTPTSRAPTPEPTTRSPSSKRTSTIFSTSAGSTSLHPSPSRRLLLPLPLSSIFSLRLSDRQLLLDAPSHVVVFPLAFTLSSSFRSCVPHFLPIHHPTILLHGVPDGINSATPPISHAPPSFSALSTTGSPVQIKNVRVQTVPRGPRTRRVGR